MDEVVKRTWVVNCLHRIGQILTEMPDSPEKGALLQIWLDQAGAILRPDLELPEAGCGVSQR